MIVDIATGEVEDKAEDEGKNPAAVTLGRLGGLKGGKARTVGRAGRRTNPRGRVFDSRRSSCFDRRTMRLCIRPHPELVEG